MSDLGTNSTYTDTPPSSIVARCRRIIVMHRRGLGEGIPVCEQPLGNRMEESTAQEWARAILNGSATYDELRASEAGARKEREANRRYSRPCRCRACGVGHAEATRHLPLDRGVVGATPKLCDACFHDGHDADRPVPTAPRMSRWELNADQVRKLRHAIVKSGYERAGDLEMVEDFLASECQDGAVISRAE